MQNVKWGKRNHIITRRSSSSATLLSWLCTHANITSANDLSRIVLACMFRILPLDDPWQLIDLLRTFELMLQLSIRELFELSRFSRTSDCLCCSILKGIGISGRAELIFPVYDNLTWMLLSKASLTMHCNILREDSKSFRLAKAHTNLRRDNIVGL